MVQKRGVRRRKNKQKVRVGNQKSGTSHQVRHRDNREVRKKRNTKGRKKTSKSVKSLKAKNKPPVTPPWPMEENDDSVTESVETKAEGGTGLNSLFSLFGLGNKGQEEETETNDREPGDSENHAGSEHSNGSDSSSGDKDNENPGPKRQRSVRTKKSASATKNGGSQNSEDDPIAATLPVLANLFNGLKGSEGSSDPSGDSDTLSLIKNMMAKGLDLDAVGGEIQKLRGNVEKMETVMKEADGAIDSVVRTMGYFGVKPKRGGWAWKRMQKLRQQEAQAAKANAAGTGSGGLDLGAMMNLASMFLPGVGGGGGSGGSSGIMGLASSLLKMPAAQNLLIDGVAKFLKK
ncbi:hypothetical protein H1S01_00450 [Heliobacterium chlorum]|uniref:Uncharacterized protein n=1 Tax=Heliobacterium chlorum TaxID=2698 RepID=A0ABR7SWP6_HELCL|nr:hypothetical protein [Heliobacterium chlorum]MBC9782975.1 hypothetical protein [Heliobacterium chlorum]